jgi:hypothetical protein
LRGSASALFAACAALLVAAPIAGAAGAITEELTTSGVKDLIPPVVSGTAAVGQVLSCSKGAWTGGPSLAYAYQWLRDGGAIKGASGKTYLVRPADQGHGLSCEVTATSSSGHASAQSSTLVVPAAPAPSPLHKIEITASTVVVSAGAARVHIGCTGAPCSGTIELTTPIVVKDRQGRRTNSRGETFIFGRAPFSLGAGQRRVLPVRLTKSGERKLAVARHHRLSVVLVASVAGAKTVREAVQLSEAH